MIHKKKILFFIESLDGGGAEGALENIVSNLDKSAYETFVVSETDGESRVGRIKQQSHYHCFAHKNVSGSRIRSIINKCIFKFSVSAPTRLVRMLLIRGRYDIEVAACEGYSTRLIAGSGDKKSKKIAWVHTDFKNNHWTEKRHIYPGGNVEEKACYEKFDTIICVSQTIKDAFVSIYGMEEKIKVVNNIIDSDKITALACEKPDIRFQHPFFVMAGSFVAVKGYERAVKVYSRLRDEGFTFSVMIMGIGYERKKVETLIEELNMKNIITLSDYQPNPYKYFKAADAYVCASYAEGYSTTVTESVILGKPVITTDCSGMKEIFGDRECGIICENSDEGLYTALKKVLENPGLLDEFARESEIRSAYFSKQRLVNETKKLFDEV